MTRKRSELWRKSAIRHRQALADSSARQTGGSDPTLLLLGFQRCRRVDTQGAPRREITGQKSHGAQDYRH